MRSGDGFVTFPESDQPKCAKPLYFVGSNTTGLKWIIFGNGGTHIYQFANRFLACLEGEHEDESNVLNRVRFVDFLW